MVKVAGRHLKLGLSHRPCLGTQLRLTVIPSKGKHRLADVPQWPSCLGLDAGFTRFSFHFRRVTVACNSRSSRSFFGLSARTFQQVVFGHPFTSKRLCRNTCWKVLVDANKNEQLGDWM